MVNNSSSGDSRQNTNEETDNDTNDGKRGRLIDKPSGETRRNVDDIGDNDVNKDNIFQITGITFLKKTDLL